MNERENGYITDKNGRTQRQRFTLKTSNAVSMKNTLPRKKQRCPQITADTALTHNTNHLYVNRTKDYSLFIVFILPSSSI